MNTYLPTPAYFDCNATTPVLPEAAQAALHTMQVLYGNPSSSHLVGIQAKHILDTSRKVAAQVVGAQAEEIIFTSGATEAIQTAILSVLLESRKALSSKKKKLLYSAIEHKAVPYALRHWVNVLNLPYEVVDLPVDTDGLIRLDILKELLPDTLMLCTMAVNNETGVIQNLSAIEQILKETGSTAGWLVDCVQALGKLDLKLNSTRIDYAVFSGHKYYAPKGIGFLYARKNAPFTPLIVGGGQEKGLRSGTENLPGVAALKAVLEKAKEDIHHQQFKSDSQLRKYRDQLVKELRTAFPNIVFNTPFEKAVPTTLNFSIPEIASREFLDLCDSAGIRLSAGSACNSTSVQPSHVLDAMGVPTWRSTSAIRLSFGPTTSQEEIKQCCNLIRDCGTVLRKSSILDGSEPPFQLEGGLIQFRVGPSNCWLWVESQTKNCIIVDPCEEVSSRIQTYIKGQNLNVLAIVDTHNHADHKSSRPELQKALIPHFKSDSQGWPIESSVSIQLGDGTSAEGLITQKKQNQEHVFVKVSTPGHTPDSVTFLYGIATKNVLSQEQVQIAFVGDTILSGGLGRTNFLQGSTDQLFYSLKKLNSILNPSTILCPGHDYDQSFATTLKAEKERNSLLKLALESNRALEEANLSSFRAQKDLIDQELAQLEKDFQGTVCGVTPTNQISQEKKTSITLEELNLKKQNKNPIILVDVREPQEYEIFRQWNTLGLKEIPRNIPLSRLANFIHELSLTKTQPSLVLICRSGNRSLQAAKTLHRLGYDQVWSLEGGVARWSCSI